MAETSGFFEATWDETLINPDTGDYGDWDLKYYAEQFARYFALFIGNGVFISPANQLLVSAGTGLKVSVAAGWGFINGHWYNNDTPMTLDVPANGTNNSRVDSVVLRLDMSNKVVSIFYNTGSIDVTRTSTIYDLILATVIVPAAATQIQGSNITDKRGDEEVCGFVKGLMDVIDTTDLFEQLEAEFEEWFDTVKDQVTGDLAIRLQLEFTQLNQNVEDYYANTQSQVEIATGLVEDYVNKDFVIDNQQFVFVNNVCTIQDSRITANTLVDVYFTSASYEAALNAIIVVDSYNGGITLTAQNTPTGTIEGMIRVRVRS